MENDDDFTFCQVHAPVEKDRLESENVVQDISRISIGDDCTNGESSNGGTLWKEKLPNNGSVMNQAKVGSLSFNVIDTSPQKQLVKDTGNSAKASADQKIKPSMKAAPRAKVPFEKGYSQMDWLKLARTRPDLAGLKGQPNNRLISLNEVKQNQREGSMWTVLKGRVYNIAPYMKFHPGGVDMLMKAVGKDCTSLFNKYHAWVNAEFLLEKCLVGTLDETQHS